ncbi:MAG: TaqI-like C-terminal specificity domain-containing protein [Caldisericia bacterium]|nr:TaqI-like C-terminal specificity domain-containing protein [Caldisericia bacterium]
MKQNDAKRIIKEVFSTEFNDGKFQLFISNLLKDFTRVNKNVDNTYVKDSFKSFIDNYRVLGYFEDDKSQKIDILEVNLTNDKSLDKARTAQRNFVADYLKSNNKLAALVAFIPQSKNDWRFSLIKLEHSLEVKNNKITTKEEITPAKRWSFLVGKNEGTHTAQSRFVNLLVSNQKPNLEEFESAFDIEVVTNEFFEKYKELFLVFKENLEKIILNDESVKDEFSSKEIDTVDFAKKTMGQIVFLYFLQKKGWFGVAPNKSWGDGPKNFLRELFERRSKYGKNFFNDVLEPLFYEALAQDRGKNSFYPKLNNCKMPFLNGGLFEPMNDYAWETTNIDIPDEVFSNNIPTKNGDKGNGILDVFDRYNFTVNENEPLEKEVAVDPEMLGKVFENLLQVRDRKSKGAFYTPREIVHYMCQECLINYLESETEGIERKDIESFIYTGDRIIENDSVALKKIREKQKRGYKYTGKYELLLAESIIKKANELDELLMNIKVADPAVGSGAFPLGMINEIVRARKILNIYLDKRLTDYQLKKHAISNSIHGVDIDPGAVEIAKLRLWLTLIVEESTPSPLPNLDHKIMQGNSLISEYEGIKLFDEGLFKKSKEFKGEQLPFGFGKSNSEIKLEDLQNKISQYVDESQKTKKQTLKEDIDNLKWEIIEESFKEQKKVKQLNNLVKLRHKNIKPFFIWMLEFSDVFKEKGGFDIVIGNPPYVGIKNNKDIFDEIKKSQLGQYYKGRCELFYFFFHLALNIGKQTSSIAFITTNYYISADFAQNLREDIKNRSIVKKLINFNELKIFTSAQGQHNIITILEKGQNNSYKSKNLVTQIKGTATPSILNSILYQKGDNTKYYDVPQSKLFDGEKNYIRLSGIASNTTRNIILNKISDGDLLGDIALVRQGLRTGIDRISKSHISKYNFQGKINSGVFVLGKNDLLNINIPNDELDIIKDFYKNSDIKKYYTSKRSSKKLIYIKKDLSEDVIKSDYPAIYNHLLKFKDLISRIRGKNNEKVSDWFTLDRPRDEKIFKLPKIVAPQRNKLNLFGYNEFDWYTSADVYFILEKDENFSLKYILALLNSKLFYFWLYFRGKRKGEYLELYQTPLSEIPIKNVSKSVQASFIKQVDQVLEITSSNDYDPQKPPIEQIRLEERINRLVYELYKLTDEEIKLIENTSK